MKKRQHLSWAWRYLSFEGRLGLFFLHRMKRNDPNRIEAAQHLRTFLANHTDRKRNTDRKRKTK
jgi:hypothetical protein